MDSMQTIILKKNNKVLNGRRKTEYKNVEWFIFVGKFSDIFEHIKHDNRI